MCRHCEPTPVHSFRLITQIGNHAWFYTNETEVTDRTPEYVIEHITEELERYHETPHQTWSWHYDARMFVLDLFAMDIFLRMLDVLNRFGSTLQQISIQPNDTMRQMLLLIKPMLPDTISNMLHVL
jgi:hypothetical protein